MTTAPSETTYTIETTGPVCPHCKRCRHCGQPEPYTVVYPPYTPSPTVYPINVPQVWHGSGVAPLTVGVGVAPLTVGLQASIPGGTYRIVDGELRQVLPTATAEETQ